MRFLGLFLVFVCVTISCPVTARTAAFNEDNIKQVLSQLDEAIRNQDAEAVSGYMTDNAQIVQYVETHDGSTQVISQPKEGYIVSLQQGWTIADEYIYMRTPAEISFDQNGSEATVKTVVSEIIKVGYKTITSTSRQTGTIIWDDGKLLISRIVGHVKVEKHPEY